MKKLSNPEINFCIEFISGDYPDTYYPGEDKLWLTVYLDEAPYGYEDEARWTVEGDCIELPMSFLLLSERGREEYIRTQMDKACEKAAQLLEDYKRWGWDIEGYRVNPHVNVMNVIEW